MGPHDLIVVTSFKIRNQDNIDERCDTKKIYCGGRFAVHDIFDLFSSGTLCFLG